VNFFNANSAASRLEAGPCAIALPVSFFEPSAQVVAPRLLGHFLVRNTPEGPRGGAIVETEAYLVGDPACHAHRGRTPRNQAMFGPPGRAYVYFIYGLHHCVNAVCRPEGCAEAVLIRAIELNFGGPLARARLGNVKKGNQTGGPARLCAALGIDLELDGVALCDPCSPLFVAANPDRAQFLLDRGPMLTTPRVGITKAVELPLRFVLAGSAPDRRAGLPAKTKTRSSSPKGQG